MKLKDVKIVIQCDGCDATSEPFVVIDDEVCTPPDWLVISFQLGVRRYTVAACSEDCVQTAKENAKHKIRERAEKVCAEIDARDFETS